MGHFYLKAVVQKFVEKTTFTRSCHDGTGTDLIFFKPPVLQEWNDGKLAGEAWNLSARVGPTLTLLLLVRSALPRFEEWSSTVGPVPFILRQSLAGLPICVVNEYLWCCYCCSYPTTVTCTLLYSRIRTIAMTLWVIWGQIYNLELDCLLYIWLHYRFGNTREIVISNGLVTV